MRNMAMPQFAGAKLHLIFQITKNLGVFFCFNTFILWLLWHFRAIFSPLHQDKALILHKLWHDNH